MQDLYKICLLLLLGLVAQAQNSPNQSPPQRNEIYLQGGLHTRGFQLGLTYAIIRQWRRTMAFEASFSEIKSSKERRQSFDALSIIGGNTKSFVYGKRNRFYQAKVGYVEKMYLSDKENPRAFAVAWCYGGGISMGMIKPYYLDLIYRTDEGSTIVRPEAFSENNIDRFLTPDLVDGESGARYGWNEMTPALGGYLKTSLLLDWGAFDDIVKAVEIGVAADFYFRRIPIMVLHEEPPIFFNIFVNLQLGKRW